jgi:[acyl-carrier-protein] S-malonyltransferase
MTSTPVAWVFPGQGSQVVGMGKDLAERYPSAARVFEEANEAIGIDLRALCFNGPHDELDRTANTQPALVATSIAALRAAEEATGAPVPEPVVVLGHSLGEFSALVAGGALKLADAVRLVRTRGELMQTADPAGAMAAVIGLDAYVIARALIGTHVVVANDNAPGQVVISGPRIELASAVEDLKKIGAKRVIPLRVSAAFHSPAMQAAAPRLRQAIDVTPFSALRYRLIANVDARVHEHAREMPALLEKQVWSPVQWVASVKQAHAEGATAFVEFGPGTVLTGLVKRILPDMKTGNVSDENTLRQSLPLLKGETR